MARKKIGPEVDLMIGAPSPWGTYINGRCIARNKTKLRNNPDLPYDDLRCKQEATAGYRVCVHHGANKKNPGGRPPIHGRRSIQAGTRAGQGLAPKIELLLKDPEWADLRKEIALLRALLEMFLEEKNEEALKDEDTQKHAARMADQIGVLVDRLHKILYGEEYSINIYGIQAFAARVAEVLNREIQDPELLLRLYKGLQDIFGDPIEDRVVPKLLASAVTVEK